ncbi:MAG: chorismate synthase [Anaerovoracaceae bacterium]
MSSSIGKNIKVQIFGESHSPGLGVTIDGLPAGEEIDLNLVQEFLNSRKPGKESFTTGRIEEDIPEIICGFQNKESEKDNNISREKKELTAGSPLTAIFKNNNTRKGDYEKLKNIPRPSHADYSAFVKHNGNNNIAGGGHFSGRLTLPLCFAGAVCLQILERKGITIKSELTAIGTEKVGDDRTSKWGNPKIDELLEKVAKEGDSVGGKIKCSVQEFPAGYGEPIFENIESQIAYGIFGIPGVKGIEFGAGFKISELLGSEANDAFGIDKNCNEKCDGSCDKVITTSNNSGGIQGGISNGMPIEFAVAVKPTPSISKEQNSVDLKKMEEVKLKIEGRHDACIAVRAVPVVTAVTAIIILDIIMN